MRSQCCLHVCMSVYVLLLYDLTALTNRYGPIAVATFINPSHQSVSTDACRLSLVDGGSLYTFPQQIINETKNSCLSRPFLCGPCSFKGNHANISFQNLFFSGYYLECSYTNDIGLAMKISYKVRYKDRCNRCSILEVVPLGFLVNTKVPVFHIGRTERNISIFKCTKLLVTFWYAAYIILNLLFRFT
jgi:hypothetical protein